MSVAPASAPDAGVLLERLIELTEQESMLIASLDLDRLDALLDERAGLLGALASAVVPASLDAAVERFGAVRDANLQAAAARRDDLRRRLGEVGTGRSAVTAYLPAGAATDGSPSLERTG